MNLNKCIILFFLLNCSSPLLAADCSQIIERFPSRIEVEEQGPEILARYIHAHRHSLRLKSLIPSSARVILLGESHLSTESKELLVESMADLKRLGVTHLGLEMLTVDHQPQIKAFEEGHPLAAAELLKTLAAHWGYVPYKYMSVIQSAHQLGIKIVAIDTSDRSLEKNDSAREDYWAKVISEHILPSSSEKMVVLAGSIHTEGHWRISGVTQLIRGLENDHKLNTVSYTIGIPMKFEGNYIWSQALGLAHSWSALPAPWSFIPTNRSETYMDGYLLNPKALQIGD